MSYVDEKIAKVTLDNSAFTKNAESTIKSLERLKQAFKAAGDTKSANMIQKEMNAMSSSVGKFVQKSESLLSKLSGIFKKSTSNIDMSGASGSIDKMNTDIANKTARTSDILSRIRGIFQKADTTDGFSNSMSAIDKLNAKIATINASPIGQAFQSVQIQVQNSISAMDIALGNFLSNALSKSVGFAKQFLSGPADGFAEYVNKMTSIQTIKSNTEAAFGGDTNRQMIQINRTLSDLNDYADQTIYSFEDMTRNIGTFTAAGVGLEDSAVAIKGIANLAAASGSSSQQASTAMYQLSQALASGKVSLMDWNSVVNAGMGGELFKNALYETADAIGTNRDKTKTFRDSLQDGWLTAEVLLETLKKFSNNESMIDAATKVKTFSQLIDTTKEAIGSGWSETWEYVFGGLEEAKGLWSDVAASVSGYIDDNQGKFFDSTLQMERNLGNFRNAMLKTWKDNGGQAAFFEGIKASVQGVMNIMSNFRSGWRDVMGDYKTQAEALVGLTNKFRDMSVALRDNVVLQMAFKNFGNIFAGISKGIMTVGQDFFRAFGMAQDSGKSFTGTLMSISNNVKDIGDRFVKSGGFETLRTIFANIGSSAGHAFGFINNALQNLISGFASVQTGGYSILTLLKNITQSIQNFFIRLNGSKQAMDVMYNLGVTLGNVWGIFKAVFSIVLQLVKSFIPSGIKMGTTFKDISEALAKGSQRLREWIEGLSNAKGKFDFINDGVRNISSGISKLMSFSSGGGPISIFDGIKSALGGLKELLKPVFSGFKGIFSLLTPGNIMAGGFVALILKLNKAIKSVTGSFADVKEHITGFNSILDLIFGKSDKKDKFDWMGGLKTGLENLTSFTKIATLVSIAVSIGILANALTKLSKLEPKDIVEGLAAIGIAIHSLQSSMNKLHDLKINPRVAGTIIALGISLNLIASAIKKLAKLDPVQVAQGTTSIVITMLSLSKSMQMLNDIKINFGTASTLIAFAIAIKIISSAVKKIGEMDLDDVAKGVGSVILLMTSLAGQIKRLNGVKISPNAAATLVAFSVAIKLISNAVEKIGTMRWQDVVKGVGSVVTILASLTVATRALNGVKIDLRSSVAILAIAAAVGTLSAAVKVIGTMRWQDIAKGLYSLSAILSGLVASATALSQIKIPMSTSAAILAIAGSVAVLAGAVKSMGSMDTGGLVKGLIGMGVSLAALVISAKALSSLGPGALVGAASVAVLAGSLSLLAPVLIAFSNMSLAGVGKSLLMFGGALGILVAAGALAGTVAPGMMALSTSMISLGIAAAGIGVGLAGAGYLLQSIGVLIQTLSTTTTDAAKNIVLAFVTIVTEIAKNAPVIVDSLVKTVSAILDGLTTLIPRIVLFGVELVISLINGIDQALPELLTAAVKLITDFAQGIADNAVHLIDAAFKIVTTLVEGIAKVFPEYAPRLGEALTEILRVAIGIVLGIINELLAPLLTAIVEAFRPLIDLILGIFSELSEALAPILEPIATVIVAVLESAASIIRTVGDVIIAIVNGISTAIQTVGQTIQTIFQTFGGIVTAIGNAIQSILVGLGAAFIGFGNGVQSILTGVGSVVESVGNSIKSVLEGVGSVVESVGNGIKTALEGVGSVFESIGKSIKSVCEGISEVVDSIGTSVSNVLDSVAGIFESLGNAAEKAGRGFKMVGQGVTEILQYSLGELVSNLGAVADVVIKIANNADGISKAGSSLTGFGKGLMSISSAGSAGVEMLLKLSMVMTTLPASIQHASSGIANFGNSIKMGVTSAMPAAISSITTLSNTVQQAVVSMSSGGIKAGQMFGMSIAQGISSGAPMVQQGAIMLGQTANQAINNSLNPSLGIRSGTIFGQGLASGINSSKGSVISATTSLTSSTVTSVRGGFAPANSLGTQFGQGIRGGITSTIGANNSASSNLARGSVNAVRSGFAPGGSLGRKFGSDIASGINGTAGTVRGAGANVSNAGRAGTQSVPWYSAGAFLSQGLANGISSMAGHVMAVASNLAARAAGAIRRALDIRSPSRVTYGFGEYFSEGFINGISSLAGEAVKTSTNLATGTADAISEGMDQIESIMTRDIDLNPTITPVVDLSNMKPLDDLYNKTIGVNGQVVDSRAVGRHQNQSNVTTNNNSTDHHYSINVNVQSNGKVDPRELAREIEREIRFNQQRDDWSLGREV